MSEGLDIPKSHHFEHEAMNTTFSLRICHADKVLAGGMAHECFDELDRLEGKLSRYLEDSDVSRINVMRQGETLFISEETHACLLDALDYYAKTGGLFDITLGTAIEHRKTEAVGQPPDLQGNLIIHPDRPAVTCQSPGRQIDLGGIGKGFALDLLKKRLVEWDAEAALLAAGSSTQLAFGKQPWPLELVGDHGSRPLTLQNAALSASGTGIQGCHIIHPDGDLPELPWKRVWLTAHSATAADVWSTTLMLIAERQLLQFPEISAEVSSLHYEDADGTIRSAGL